MLLKFTLQLGLCFKGYIQHNPYNVTQSDLEFHRINVCLCLIIYCVINSRLCLCMGPSEGVEVNDTYCQPQHEMDVSGQHHTLAAFSPGK
jgi:hypothetical protein